MRRVGRRRASRTKSHDKNHELAMKQISKWLIGETAQDPARACRDYYMPWLLKSPVSHVPSPRRALLTLRFELAGFGASIAAANDCLTHASSLGSSKGTECVEGVQRTQGPAPHRARRSSLCYYHRLPRPASSSTIRPNRPPTPLRSAQPHKSRGNSVQGPCSCHCHSPNPPKGTSNHSAIYQPSRLSIVPS